MHLRKLESGSIEDGASLAGLLMVVVMLGALSAVAVIGVSSLTGSGGSVAVISPGVVSTTINTSIVSSPAAAGVGIGSNPATDRACQASADAARAASAAYFANAGGSYPVKFSDLTTGNPPTFALTQNVVVNAVNPAELDGKGWKLIMSGGGTTAPVFVCR